MPNHPCHDPVNAPSHYNSHPSGIECIQVTEYMNFCLGNAMKYIWRADMKGGIEDLQKAIWYLNREIERRGDIEDEFTNQDAEKFAELLGALDGREQEPKHPGPHPNE